MIVKRDKQFSLWNRVLGWTDKYNAKKGFPTDFSKTKNPSRSTNNTQKKLPLIGKPIGGNNKIRSASFKELYDLDPWPALCTLGVLAPKSEKDVNEMEQLLLDKGIIKGGEIEMIYVINDNIKGSAGANVNCIIFSPETKIDSEKRLVYGDRLKWPEDFLTADNSYYKWYRSGNKLLDN